MAFNPFKSKPPVEKPNRNAFDLSFANNLTLEFGKLYPVFAKECLPGDTFRIKPTFGFRFMPMYFPVQSRMRADLKFFYVRNRNLWDNWKKFIGQTDKISGQSVTPPYLDIRSSNSYRLATGSLLDYLGVPTTAPQMIETEQLIAIGGNSSNTLTDVSDNLAPVDNGLSSGIVATGLTTLAPNGLTYSGFQVVDSVDVIGSDIVFGGAYSLMSLSLTPLRGWSTDVNPVIKAYYQDVMNADGDSVFSAQFNRSGKAHILIFRNFPRMRSVPGNDISQNFMFVFGMEATPVVSDGIVELTPSTTIYTSDTSLSFGSTQFNEFIDNLDFENEQYYMAIALPYVQSALVQEIEPKVTGLKVVFPYALSISVSGQYNEDIGLKSPFINNGSGPAVKLSALLPRAYEAICNTDFYRNVEVDPFRINQSNVNSLPLGTEPPEYDKFIPNSGDGADSYPYNFHYKYWEDDFLTDAMPSPQMGIAPLVGARAAEGVNTRTFIVDYSSVADGTSAASQLRVQADPTTGQVLNITGYNGPDLEMLQDAISYGISINDFRNVNALQKWLEKNVRRGYRYKDQMMSHFGVSLSYEECDMPEYIGGFSEDVDVRAISQSVGTVDAPLGSLAGQASCVGSSKHEIDKYTDEHGFIIGILCITPIPTYSQLLPKHWTKDNALDYFTPEFGHIGYQAIPVQEVTPLNVSLENPTASTESLRQKMLETFGYQRAWYDYLSSTDEVHGQFRTTMRDYLVDRVFDGVPKLSKEFLEVNPKEVNDIFNYTGSDDKIVGQMWFDTTVVRPIPKYGTPKLD